MNGIGSHQSAKILSDIWFTPPGIIQDLGPFDLDPCSHLNRPWDTAKFHYTEFGLTKSWFGFIWCNPPYGQQTHLWLEKMAQYNNGIALIFARTETAMFFKSIWPVATSLLFIKGRLFFHRLGGIKAKANAGAPSVLIAYGKEADTRLKKCTIDGKYINLHK